MQEQLETSIDTDKHREEKADLKKLILDIRDWLKYFSSKRLIILLVVGLGALAGLAFAFLKKTEYIATTSFVMESSGGGLGGYAGVASSLGIDLGGGGGGLFGDQNIQELYKSRKMITAALLSEADFSGKRQLLVDRYVEMSDLQKKLNDNPHFKKIRFRKDGIYATPDEQLAYDGLMGRIAGEIVGKYLEVGTKDKKNSILEIKVTTPDELFSLKFNNQIVSTVNDFYYQTKTRKLTENLAILEEKADSVRGALSGAISRGAAVADATPNQNPTRMAQRVVPIQNARINAEMSQGTLSTLIQNVEMSKISLLKEAPLIQIVDQPILPLSKKSFGKLLGLLIGGFLGGILIVLYLALRRLVKDAINS